MKTYEAKIRLPSGTQKVRVQANDKQHARELLEAQYGKGCIYTGPDAKSW